MTRNGQRLLLLIDDEPAQRRLVAAIAARRGMADDLRRRQPKPPSPRSARRTGCSSMRSCSTQRADADGDPAPLIAELRLRRPALPILMLTAASVGHAGGVGDAIAGATDFLVKPIAAERLLMPRWKRRSPDRRRANCAR